MSLRAKIANWCMGEPVPFGQIFNYHADHAIDDMVAPGYFMPVRGFLKTGDRINVCQVGGGRVREIATLLVVQSCHEFVDLSVIGDRVAVPDRVTPPEIKYPTVRRGFGGFEVRDRDGATMATKMKRRQAEELRAALEKNPALVIDDKGGWSLAEVA